METFFRELFQRFGRLAFLLIALSLGLGVLIIDMNAKPNTEVTILFGLVQYTKDESKKINSLDNHRIFNRFNAWIYNDIPKIRTTKTAKDFLLIKFKVWKEKLNNISKNKGLEKLSKSELYEYLLNILEMSVATYEKQCRERGIPESFIDNFNDIHKNKVIMMKKEISLIVYSDYYSDYNSRMAAIFDSYITTLNMTITDTEINVKTNK